MNAQYCWINFIISSGLSLEIVGPLRTLRPSRTKEISRCASATGFNPSVD